MFNLGDIVKIVSTGQAGQVKNMTSTSTYVQTGYLQFDSFETSDLELLVPAFVLEEITRKNR